MIDKKIYLLIMTLILSIGCNISSVTNKGLENGDPSSKKKPPENLEANKKYPDQAEKDDPSITSISSNLNPVLFPPPQAKFPPGKSIDNSCQNLLKQTVPVNRSERIQKAKARYLRCYQQFTMKRIPLSDSRLVQINSGDMSGIDACMDLFNKASLTDGEIISGEWRLKDSSSSEGQRVLKTFNDLHRSWFTNLEFPRINSSWNTEDLLDNSEPALYYTRSLFSDAIDYESVLKGNAVLGGIRATDHEYRNNQDHTGHLGYYLHAASGTNRKSFRDVYKSTGYHFSRDTVNGVGRGGDFNDTNKWKPYTPGEDHPSRSARDFIKMGAPINETGKLIGIRSRSKQFENTQLRNYCGLDSTNLASWLDNGFGGVGFEEVSFTKLIDKYGNIVEDPVPTASRALKPGYGFNARIGWSSPVDLFQSLGGGAMGSHAFILQNFDDTFPKLRPGYENYGTSQKFRRTVSDGSINIQRRWAKRVLSDFLCREVPVINYNDLDTDDIDYVVEDTNVPFRKAALCMRCHATIDQMAMAARNAVIERTGTSTTRYFRVPTFGEGDFCIATEPRKVQKWINGEWVIEDLDEDYKPGSYLAKYEVHLPEGSYQPYPCLPDNHFWRGNIYGSEKDRKAYWPNAYDTWGSQSDNWGQKDKCNKGAKEKISEVRFTKDIGFTWHEEPVPGYHKSKPLGKFLFREYDKNIDEQPINVNVEGVEDLAKQLRRTEDFYTCGAKRYLEFLTGIKTLMFHQNPFNNMEKLNPTKNRHQKLMECLGKDLRASNDPKDTIRKIISADFYLDPSELDIEIKNTTEDDPLIEEPIEDKRFNLGDVKPILVSKCIGCHGGLDSWVDNDYVSRKLPGNPNYEISVIPGRPCESKLFTKMNLNNSEGFNPCQIEKPNLGNMPIGGAALTRQELEMIYNWIENLR